MKNENTDDHLPEKLSHSEKDYEIVLILSKEEKFFRHHVEKINIKIVENEYLQQILKHQIYEFTGKTRLVNWRTAFEETFPKKREESPYKEIYTKLEKKEEADISKQPSDLLTKRIQSIMEERMVKLAVAGYKESGSLKALYNGLSNAKGVGKGVPRLIEKDRTNLPDRIEFLDGDDEQKGRFAKGSLTIVAGPGGVGKGCFITGKLGAAVTSGGEFMGVTLAQGQFFLLDLEDPWPTLRDRIVNNGGDLRNFHWLELEKDADGYAPIFSLRENLESLAEVLKSVPEDVRKKSLVVIDNLGTFMGFKRGIDAMNQYDVRKVLQPIAVKAEELKISIVIIGNFNKNKLSELIHAISDSVAFGDTCRAAYVIIADEEDGKRLYFLPAKWNLKELKDTGVEFRIEENTDRIIIEKEISAEQARELRRAQEPGEGRDPDKAKDTDQFLERELRRESQRPLDMEKKAKTGLICGRDFLYRRARMMRKKGMIETMPINGKDHWVWRGGSVTKEVKVPEKEVKVPEDSKDAVEDKDLKEKIAEAKVKVEAKAEQELDKTPAYVPLTYKEIAANIAKLRDDAKKKPSKEKEGGDAT